MSVRVRADGDVVRDGVVLGRVLEVAGPSWVIVTTDGITLARRFSTARAAAEALAAAVDRVTR